MKNHKHRFIIVIVTDGAAEGKNAGAHDLRRSFGERWASRIMPQTLMEPMRHEDIDTTMKYYVVRNVEATATTLYAAFGKNLARQPTLHIGTKANKVRCRVR